jgi:catechol 2,3-dioxygenase-like lactoylglutathione lyase family enzyme
VSITKQGNEFSDDSPRVPMADMKVEVVVIPVSDVDRAKGFYAALGWRLDIDFAAAPALRRAAAAHDEHERRIGKQDADWADWYADYISSEQTGKPVPS